MAEPSRYSHDYNCSIEGIPYRLGVLRASSQREVHVEDAERVFDALHADLALAERNWLVLFMLPHPADWVSDRIDPSERLPSSENVPDVAGEGG